MGYHRELKDLGRGVAGALIFGTPFLLTMETWWLGWTLPPWILLGSALGTVIMVLVLARFAGFRTDHEDRGRNFLVHWVSETSGIVLESAVAAYLVLGLYGVVEWTMPWAVLTRLGLIEVVALAIGAAVANDILAVDGDIERERFPKKVALFVLGSIFFTLHLAPTEEITLLAAYAGWGRLAGILVLSVLLAHLILFELEFRGQASRTVSRSHVLLWGEGFLVVLLSLVVSFLMLAGLGAFLGQTPEVWLQKSIVLALPATIGASAARVVLG